VVSEKSSDSHGIERSATAATRGAPYLFVRRSSSPPGKPDRPTYLGGVHVDDTAPSSASFDETSGTTTFHVQLRDVGKSVITVTAAPHPSP
jgi:hypothetical protein